MIGPELHALLALPRDPVPAGVHPSWAVAVDVGDPVSVWRARWANLPPLPPGLPDPLPELVALGRDQLAFATGLRDGLLAGARTAHLTDKRAAIKRCQGVALDELGLIRVGARCLTLGLVEQRQLVVRLPRQIGLVVERELAAERR